MTILQEDSEIFVTFQTDYYFYSIEIGLLIIRNNTQIRDFNSIFIPKTHDIN